MTACDVSSPKSGIVRYCPKWPKCSIAPKGNSFAGASWLLLAERVWDKDAALCHSDMQLEAIAKRFGSLLALPCPEACSMLVQCKASDESLDNDVFGEGRGGLD
eukprot:scaffold56562_cov18-Tisochrysis_lutea.AAC.1